MPLIKANLSAGIKAISDDPPESQADAAEKWATAIVDYATPVIPASTTVAGGKSALQSSLETAFGSPAAAPGMEAAFTSFGATIGGGMAGFVAVPPPGPVGFAALFAGTTDDTQEAADNMADAIDTWMKTGTATPVGGGPLVNWS
jgi:hypothetical protein